MDTFNLMYYSDFVSVSGRHWRIEISGGGTADMGPVPLPADRPLVLEWQETEHYEPLQASSATLRVISESDRRFLDTLYSEIPCEVRLDVLLDGKLYWRGTLDTEFYEEPYSYRDGYEVSLTFSDLAVLDRLDFDLGGRVTALELLNTALDRAALSGVPVTQMSSLSFPDAAGKIGLADILVDTSNFYDEDGKPSSWRDALAAVLQPLSFRLVQRSGRFCVYDLCALRGRTPAAVEWDGTDAVLSRDRVYSRVTISVSPYGSADVLVDCITAEDPSGLDPVKDGALTVYTSYYDVDSGNPHYNTTEGLTEGFRLYLGDKTGGKGVTLGDQCRYFLMDPVNDGDDTPGVLALLRYGHIGTGHPRPDGSSGLTRYGYAAGWPADNGLLDPSGEGHVGQLPNDMPVAADSEVFTTERIFLRAVHVERSEVGSVSYAREDLKISLDLLLDVRYNPFEDADPQFEGDYYPLGNEAGNWEDFQKVAVGYVPVRLAFYSMSGECLGVYSNKYVFLYTSSSQERRKKGKWIRQGNPKAEVAYLAYYSLNGSKLSDSAGLGGWQTNKPMIWADGCRLPEWYNFHDEGEIMENPADVFGEDGYIEMTVLQGVALMGGGNGEPNSYGELFPDLYGKFRWVAYRNPRITVIDSETGEDASGEDFELSTSLNVNAREGLQLDLTVGSYGDLPNCRGLLLRADTGERISALERSGVAGRPEMLLAGSIYSQYAAAKLRLSGTMCLLDETKSYTVVGPETQKSGTAVPINGLSVYKDAAMPGRLFFMTSDVQDVIREESQAVLTELGPEDYSNLEIEED